MKTRIFLIVLVMAMMLPMLAACDILSESLVVQSTYVNDNGELIIVYTNGITTNVGRIDELGKTDTDGTSGTTGDTGTGESPGTSENPDNGEDPNPTDPADEITVTECYLDEDGNLIVVFSNGTVKNLGKPNIDDSNDSPGEGVNGGDNYIMPEIIDMGRYQYNAYVRSQASGNGAFYCEDFWVDPSLGGRYALSYAVVQRNQAIERTYNCQIKAKDSTMQSQFEEMSTFFDGGTKYELAILVAVDAASCATAGILSDLKHESNTQYMDLSHEAFDQNSIAQLTIGNSLYYLSGDMNISTMDNTMATAFNIGVYNTYKAEIVEKLGNIMYGDVYKMVEDGKWTIENMLKIANCVTYDVDESDGPIDASHGDMIGYYEYGVGPLFYYYNSGMRITENYGGYPQFTIDTDEAAEVYDFLYKNFNVGRNPNIPQGMSSDRAKNFEAGQVLFVDYILWDIRKQLYTLGENVPYGILPLATMEENAEQHHVVWFENLCHLWTIPYNRANKEYAARMMYIMAAYSGKPDSTMDAYYINTRYVNFARDDGSRASLEIIKDTLTYDIALIYSADNQGNLWGNFDNMLKNIVLASSPQYAARTDGATMTKANEQLQTTIDWFSQNSGG